MKESVERLLKKGTSRVLFDLGDDFNKEAAEYNGADPFVLTPNPNAVVGGNPVGSGVMSSIVNSFNQIVGIGYNGFPRGCSDDVLPWGREGSSELDTKYMYVCHAEMNAILNINTANARGCKAVVRIEGNA